MRTGAPINRGSLFLLAVTLAASTGACGARSPASSTGRPGESATCTAILSGAVAGTIDCRPATTEIGDRELFEFSGLSGTDGGQELDIGAIIYFVGGTAPASYTQASPAGDLGGVDVVGAAGDWSTLGPGGGYQLTFASFSNPVTYPGGTLYSAEGTLDATLVPGTGNTGTGTVMLHATF
jgi:hypothetical protein